MSAQQKWNEYFIDFLSACAAGHMEDAYVIRSFMRDIRREAALERKLAAAQRRIAELETELNQSEEAREFAARLEFGG